MQLNRILTLIVSFSLAAVPCAQAKYYLPANLTLAQVQASTDRIMAWDIHEVLVNVAKAKRIFYGILGVPLVGTHATTAAFSTMLAPLTGHSTASHKVWQEIHALPKERAYSSDAYYNVCRKHGLTKLANFTDQMGLLYEPTPGMQKVVEAIHSRGIPQRIASNIGPRAYQALTHKMSTRRCTTFTFMQPGVVTDYNYLATDTDKVYSTQMARPAGLTHGAFTDHLLSIETKPHAQFYDLFMNHYRKSIPGTIVIFIDDKLENVLAATRSGMVGIHFDRSKGVKHAVHQLIRDLCELNILTAPIRL